MSFLTAESRKVPDPFGPLDMVSSPTSTARIATRVLVGGCIFALALVGCSADDPVVPPVPDAQVTFEPAPGDLTLVAFQTLRFRATDANGDELIARFLVNGAELAEASSLNWRGEVVGLAVVEAIVETEDGEEFRATWRVTVTEEGTPETPAVALVSATVGPDPGSMLVVWDRPGLTSDNVPIASYTLAYSEVPIADADFDTVDQVVVAHDDSGIRQRWQLEGLSERTIYYVRVRARDLFDRVSDLSPQTFSEATGHFNVTGRVQAFDPVVPLAPLPGVLADLNGYRDITNAAGEFQLLNLPDLFEERLTVQYTAGQTYYAVRTTAFEPVDFSLDLVLFPRDFVVLRGQTPQDDSTLTLLTFLKRMTGKEFQPESPLYRWQDYPVEIYTPPFTHTNPQTQEVVDYREAFLFAAAGWNERAGQELIRIVDAPVAVGGEMIPDLGTGQGAHGSVELLEPAGILRSVTPRKVAVHMVNQLATQDFANRVAAHELGHVLLLQHSDAVDHIMNLGAPAVTGGRPHPDEGHLARLIAAIAQGTNLHWYTDPE